MKFNKIYYFLTFLVIAISGNPAMNLFGAEAIYIGTLICLLTLFFRKSSVIAKSDVKILIYFACIMVIHILMYGLVVVAASIGYFIKLSIALLAVKLIPSFSRRYVNSIYILSCISLLFFIPSLFGNSIEMLIHSIRLPLGSNIDHIGIYNIQRSTDGMIRNSGMFWEPGAFAGYIIIALFLLIRDGNNSKIFSKHGLVLFLALLSTQSTTGYITLAVLLVLILHTSNLIKDTAIKLVTYILFFAMFVPLLSLTYTNYDFLGDKIINQYDDAVASTDASRINRFGNFIYDLKLIKERPIFGWGGNPATRLKFDAESLDLAKGQGNGLTGFTVRFGLTGLLIYLVFLFRATNEISNSIVVSIFGILIICLLLNGEQFLNFPIFYTLIFIPKKSSLLEIRSVPQIVALNAGVGRTGFRP